MHVKCITADSCERDNHDYDDDNGGCASDTNGPVHAPASRFLVLLGLLNVSLCFLGVFQSSPSIMVDFNKVLSLIVNFRIDILSDRVDVRHELLDII